MSSIQVYERMWQFMTQAETGVFVSSNEEGVRRVRDSKGKYAFLTGSHLVLPLFSGPISKFAIFLFAGLSWRQTVLT